jgi:hypothetical protein
MRNNFLFQNYLVVFLDHLGQRENLRKITEIPTNEIEKQKFIENLKKSVGKVLGTRDLFKDYVEAARSYEPDLNRVPSEYRDKFLEFQKEVDLGFYGVSDSVIIAVPLMNNNDENWAAIKGVYSAFVATCGIGLSSLSVHVAMRAGLDIGVATQIDDKEIYGPALERAFYLESKLAEYPRFLVGKELISYLLWMEKRECSTLIGKAGKELAKFCREMIIQDTDGRFMLDFLGDKIKKVSGDAIDKTIVDSAFKFVISQYNKYLKEENEKLTSRYYRLLLYFHSRKSIWELS